jgi:hypothetical protein
MLTFSARPFSHRFSFFTPFFLTLSPQSTFIFSHPFFPQIFLHLIPVFLLSEHLHLLASLFPTDLLHLIPVFLLSEHLHLLAALFPTDLLHLIPVFLLSEHLHLLAALFPTNLLHLIPIFLLSEHLHLLTTDFPHPPIFLALRAPSSPRIFRQVPPGHC